MTTLNIRNPFDAPVYHEETVTSTMDVSRALAAVDEKHGAVITADFQEAGRGRGQDRSWQMNRGENMAFTLLLRYPCGEDIPSALTLRIGLAVSLAIEDFAPSLRGLVMVKWPNDILIGEKKAVGILCEADGGNVHAGIGINVAQKEFPPHLRKKATSIALAAGMNIAPDDRFLLLEKILARLFSELETTAGENWKNRLEQRLYKNGEQVTFIEGAAGSGSEVKGRLAGIGEGGELLITLEGEAQPRAFVTGELKFL
jgi:BirA family biotin operon repressor/biotin-[acetyl-CoA-carboxylase] ligase